MQERIVMAWRVLWRLLFWLWKFISVLSHGSPKPSYSGPRMHHVRRLASGWGIFSGSAHPLAKPDWVKSTVLQLANDLPHAGCRMLANSFNLAHAGSGHRISKTWVYELLKARAAALALARLKSRRMRRFTSLGEPIQRVWGIDLTGLPLKSGETVNVWGIVDHGSRAVLQLEPLKKFNSLILLGKLLVAFGTYGIPKAIRSDNASVFKTPLFRAMLKLLGVKQQFTELHSPWQNGRIERFWRTCKETLGTNPVRMREGLRVIQEQMRFASLEAMQSVLAEFRDFYNHSRPHMALKGQTPAFVWNAQIRAKRERLYGGDAAKDVVRASKRRSARAPPST